MTPLYSLCNPATRHRIADTQVEVLISDRGPRDRVAPQWVRASKFKHAQIETHIAIGVAKCCACLQDYARSEKRGWVQQFFLAAA